MQQESRACSLPWLLCWTLKLLQQVGSIAPFVIACAVPLGQGIGGLWLATGVEAAAIALALPLYHYNHLKRWPFTLDAALLVIFAALALLGEAAPAWTAVWMFVALNAAVAAFMLAGLWLSQPFMMEIGQEVVGKRWWDHPVFIAANYQLTWMWFGVASGSSLLSVIPILYPPSVAPQLDFLISDIVVWVLLAGGLLATVAYPLYWRQRLLQHGRSRSHAALEAPASPSDGSHEVLLQRRVSEHSPGAADARHAAADEKQEV